MKKEKQWVLLTNLSIDTFSSFKPAIQERKMNLKYPFSKTEDDASINV